MTSLESTKFNLLPASVLCLRCNTEKPLAEMIQFRDRKRSLFCVRRICKECHNAAERGHRREYKRRYLHEWRRRNAALDKSYWQNDRAREQARLRAERQRKRENDALLIQGRMNRRGQGITIADARQLLATFGRCYPTRFGLTEKGFRECERIRSRLRFRSDRVRMPSSFEIRLMVYEQGLDEPSLLIPPDQQPRPYKIASERLKQYHRNQRILEAA